MSHLVTLLSNVASFLNILGTDGSCESLTPFSVNGTTPTLSTTQKKSGPNSIKFVPSASLSYLHKDYNFQLDLTKQYIIGAWVYLESYTSGNPFVVQLYDFGSSAVARYSAIMSTATIGSWQFVYTKVPTSNTLVGSGFRLIFGAPGTSTLTSYFDDIRLYEVSPTLYTAIGTIYATGEAVDSVIPYKSTR